VLAARSVGDTRSCYVAAIAMTRPRALVSWSSGKDSALALHEARASGVLEIVGLVTTVTAAFERVSMHGVRNELLDRQADAVGLPCRKIEIPSPCPNEVYERELAATLTAARADGVSHVVFGDLFLADIRSYREGLLAPLGLECVFPLWQRPTAQLAREMIESGVCATLTCVDLARLDRTFAGRAFDGSLLAALPAGVDPCGENGEFHTFVTAGPMLRWTVAVHAGEVVIRDGFAFADLIPG
jgi:uncharacterized protein (TIGR00290 family)